MQNNLRHFLIIIILALNACSSINSSNSLSNKQINPIAASNINIELAMIYLQKGDTSQAKQKLLFATQQAPKNPAVWYAMGYFLEKTGESNKAADYYLKAVKIAPNQGAAQNNYGAFLCRQGYYPQAIQHFLIAVKDVYYLDTAKAYENAGLCALKIPDLTAAQHYFLRALAHDPRLSKSLLHLAQIYQQQGNIQLANYYQLEYQHLVAKEHAE